MLGFNLEFSPWGAVQPLHLLLLVEQTRPTENMSGPTPAATTVSRRQAASHLPRPQFLYFLQQTRTLLPGRFFTKAAFGVQNHGGRSSTASTGWGGPTARGVQTQSPVWGGAAGRAPAGLLVVCCASSGRCRGVWAGSGLSVTLVASLMAFALRAAGAVDGADIVEFSDITQRQLLGSGGAVRQAQNVCFGVKAMPSSCLLVVGPVGADGTDIVFVTFVSLK